MELIRYSSASLPYEYITGPMESNFRYEAIEMYVDMAQYGMVLTDYPEARLDFSVLPEFLDHLVIGILKETVIEELFEQEEIELNDEEGLNEETWTMIDEQVDQEYFFYSRTILRDVGLLYRQLRLFFFSTTDDFGVPVVVNSPLKEVW